jgi:hypothetical protein
MSVHARYVVSSSFSYYFTGFNPAIGFEIKTSSPSTNDLKDIILFIRRASPTADGAISVKVFQKTPETSFHQHFGISVTYPTPYLVKELLGYNVSN